MRYILDTEINLKDHVQCNYFISSQHRKKGNPNKSVWTITFNEEVSCFIQALTGNWKTEKEAWGIKAINNILQVIGLSADEKELKFAKFVNGANTNVWHGYPADYLRKAQDRPATQVLKVWVENGYLTKSKMSKIRLGQSCTL